MRISPAPGVWTGAADTVNGAFFALSQAARFEGVDIELFDEYGGDAAPAHQKQDTSACVDARTIESVDRTIYH